jgi:hypothetical protein
MLARTIVRGRAGDSIHAANSPLATIALTTMARFIIAIISKRRSK